MFALWKCLHFGSRTWHAHATGALVCDARSRARQDVRTRRETRRAAAARRARWRAPRRAGGAWARASRAPVPASPTRRWPQVAARMVSCTPGRRRRAWHRAASSTAWAAPRSAPDRTRSMAPRRRLRTSCRRLQHPASRPRPWPHPATCPCAQTCPTTSAGRARTRARLPCPLRAHPSSRARLRSGTGRRRSERSGETRIEAGRGRVTAAEAWATACCI